MSTAYWIYLLLAALLGLAIGFAWGRNTRPDLKARADLESRMAEADERHEKLQSEIAAHFSESARLVNQLSHQYRAVHEHLAEGHKALVDPDRVDPDDKIQSLVPPPSPDSLIENTSESSQPKDYSEMSGTLNEANQRGQAAATEKN